MSIITIQRDTNNNLSLVRMTVTDNLATVAGNNYIANNQEAINLLNGGVWSWYKTDMILVAASDGNAFFQFTDATFSTLIIYGEQGSGVINPGLANQIAYYPANGTTLSGLATLANAVLATNGSSVPAMTQILPSAVQLNITNLGTVTVGTWTASTITVPFGGTGNTTFTPYTLICAGITSTGAFQNVVSVGSAGDVLVSNGAGALPTFQTGIASGIIDIGNQNDLPFYSASPSGKTLSPIAGAVNSVLVTSGLGVPSLSQTLPNAVQDNITRLGTIVSIGSPLGATFGGTGLNTYVLGDIIYASAANTLSRLAGNTTSGIQYLAQTGTGVVSAAPAWTTISGGDITGAALTKTDDTNVTLTLGGSPTTALLRAASLTLGWTGQLGLTRGGTNASLIASNGGIVYSTAVALAILAGTATANQVLLSGSNAAPSWSTATYPSTTTINQLLYSSANNTITGLATVNSSVLTTSAGGVPTWSLLTGFANAPVNTNITSMTGLTGVLQAPTFVNDVNGNHVVQFASTASAVNYIILQNSSTGNGPSVGVGGTDSVSGLTLSVKNSFVSLIDSTNTTAPDLRFYNSAGTHFIGLKAPTLSGDTTFTLPTADGTANFPITTNGSGQLQFGAIAAAAMATLGGSGMSHIGQFTRDLTTASGTQSITGVGFRPSLVIFLACVSPSVVASWGFDNGTTSASTNSNAGGTAGSFGVSAASIALVQSASNNQTAAISSFGSDGFTLTWVKGGSPTGTATINYLAFK